jgi:hypothetical protein
MRPTPNSVRGTILCASAFWLAGTTVFYVVLPPRPRAAVTASRQWVAGFCCDGQAFLTTGDAPWQQVDVRRTADATFRSHIDVGRSGTGPATLSPDGRLLAFPTGAMTEVRLGEVGPTPGVVVWDIEVGRERCRLNAAEGPIAFAPDGWTLATGDASRMGVVRVWDLTAHLPSSRSLSVSPGPIGSLGFSPDGRFFVAVGGQLTMSIALMSEIARSRTAPGPQELPLLSTGGAAWWSTDNWRAVGRVANSGRSLLDTGAAFVAADRLAVVRNDLPQVVRIIDVATGAERVTIPIPPGASTLAPSMTGGGSAGVRYYRDDLAARLLELLPRRVSGQGRPRYRPTAVLYDAETAAERARLTVDPDQAFLSPDGGTLVAWDDGEFTVWDVPPRRFTWTWAALSAAFGVPILAVVGWRIRAQRRVGAAMDEPV